MIVVVPVVAPDIMPDDDPIVATAVLLLLHVPPPVVQVSVPVPDAQMLRAPEMVAGMLFTVTTCIVKQPVDVFVTVIRTVP